MKRQWLSVICSLAVLLLVAACNSKASITATPVQTKNGTAAVISMSTTDTATQAPTPTEPPAPTALPNLTSGVVHPTRTANATVDENMQHELRLENRYTSTPLPTRTPTPTLTPNPTRDRSKDPTSTPTVVVSWADWFAPPLILNRFEGSWSPTDNEMVSGHRPPNQDKPYSVAVAAAPDFAIRYFDLGEIVGDPIWSPNGSSILFGLANPDTADMFVNVYSFIWSVERTGENAHYVSGEQGGYWLLEFAGWMDDNTVVTLDYTGGSHYMMDMLDYQTGEVVGGAGPIYGVVDEPNLHYVPVIWDALGIMQLEMFAKESFRSTWVFDEPGEYIAQQFAIWMGDRVCTMFETWKLESDQLLIYATLQSEQALHDMAMVLEKTNLILWDLDSNTTSWVIPNGVTGRFSPDGKLLAVVTLGQASVDGSGKLIAEAFDEPLQANHPYLYLLDANSLKVALGIPAYAVPGLSDEYLMKGYWGYVDYPAMYAFSPDSQYLAFLSTGAVTMDENGQLLVDEIDQSNDQLSLYVNVIDTKTNQLIQSVPSLDEAPLWSPDHEHLIYRDLIGNWNLLMIPSGRIRPLTLKNGGDFERAAWSYDGRYLALYRGRQTAVILVRP